MEEFIEQLLGLLRDDDENIVRHAIAALREHKSEEVVKALEEALADVHEEVVADLVEALLSHEPWSKPGGRRQLLEKLLAHNRAAVRFSGVSLLSTELNDGDTKTLVSSLEKEDNPEVIATLLGVIDERFVSMGELIEGFLHHVDERVRANAVEAMGKIGRSLPEEQLDTLMADPSNRVRANVIMRRWESERLEMKELVLKELEATDVKRQRCALYLLGKLRPFEEAADLLCQRLMDSSIHIRRLAGRGLLSLDGPISAQKLVAAFIIEQDGEVREQLAEVLGSFRTDTVAALSLLSEHLTNKALDPEKRALAARGLAEIGTEKALPYIKKAVRDEDARVRANAVEGIARWGGAEAQALLEALLADPTPRVCANAALELYRMGSASAIPSLVAMLESQEPRKQGCAAFALGEIGTEDVVGPLTEAYQALSSQIVSTDDQLYVRDNVSRALEKIRDGSKLT